jgi:hypothetical protein
MADYSLPSSLKFQSFNGPNSVTFTVTATHTAVRPHIVIFDRVMPKTDPKTGNVTFGRYRVRRIRACVDANGVPTGRNAVVETSSRFPPEAASADIQADLAAAGTMLADAGFQDDSVVELALPPMVSA